MPDDNQNTPLPAEADIAAPADNQPNGMTPEGQAALTGPGTMWGHLHLATPHVVQGSWLEHAIQTLDPSFKGAVTKEQSDADMQKFATQPQLDALSYPPVDVASSIDKKQHPIAKALVESAQGFATPTGLATIAATGGESVMEKLAAAGFSVNAIHEAYKHLSSFKDAYDSGDASEAMYQLTHGLVNGSIAYLTGKNAAEGAADVIREKGAQARENMAARKEARLNEARTGKIITVQPEEKGLPDHMTFEDAGGQEVSPPVNTPTPIEGEIPEPQNQEALARRGEMPNQRFNFNPAYGDIGGYVGGLDVSTTSGAMRLPYGMQRKIEDLGATYTPDLLPSPDTHQSPEEINTHELSHAVAMAHAGVPVDGAEIWSHLHPMSSPDSAGSISLDLTKIPGTVQVGPSSVRFSQDALTEFAPKLIQGWLGGGIGQETMHGVPHETNLGMTGDWGQIDRMAQAMGWTDEEKADVIRSVTQKNFELLDNPAVKQIIGDAAKTREIGLLKSHLFSSEKVQDVVKRALEAYNESIATKPNAERAGVNQTVEPGTAPEIEQGNLREDNGQIVPATAAETIKPGTIADNLVQKFGTTNDPHEAGFILEDGRMIPLKADHNDMIASAMRGAPPATMKELKSDQAAGLTRENFIDREHAIRTRYRTGRGGKEVVFSVPKTGVSDAQLNQIRASVGKLHNGNVVMETTDPAGPTTQKEFARASDVDGMLRQIGAHPDQHEVATQTKNQKSDEPAVTVKPDETGYAAVPPDAFFMFASPTEHASQAGGFQPGKWNMQDIYPNEKLQASANRYAKAQGMPEINHAPVAQDVDRARQIAQQYHEAEHAPNDPAVKAAYDALKSETKMQFHHLRDDLGLKFEPHAEDPYLSAQQMMDDVRQNNRLKVFTGSGPSADHPLAEVDPETGETYNTLFRWVHDAYGHAAGGNDFSERGEKSATEAHAQMYSPTARPAMRAETEGQTSWFFHNPDVESGAKQPGEFAPQKATLIREPGEVPSTSAISIPTGSKFVPISPEDYRAELDRSPRAKEFLQDTAEQLRGDKLFKMQTPEGKDMGIAYSITPDGELRGLVNNGPFTGATELAVKDAFKQGATHTQYSWDLNGRVADFYRKMGGGRVISAPYDEKTYGPPSEEMKAAWKKAGWKEGEPYPHYTQYVAKGAVSTVSEAKVTPRMWHTKAAAMAQKDAAGAIDPKTGSVDEKGTGSEIFPELRQSLDHKPTAADFKAFAEQNKKFLENNPDLRIGWDNNGANGPEINIGGNGKGAVRVARKLNQLAAYDIAKGENIDTGGTGKRTEFPNYPLEDRVKDLRDAPLSNIKGFENLSKDVHDNLAPDEKKYLEGNKNLQRRVMDQYHALLPSVPETSNAMQAGAALSGWWKRYMDIFQTWAPEPSKGLALFHGTHKPEILREPFEQFRTQSGPQGEIGAHFGTSEQAGDRITPASGNPDDSSRTGLHIRPVYVDIKNPIRLEDNGKFTAGDVVRQLIDQKILTPQSAMKFFELEDKKDFRGNTAADPKKVVQFLESKGYDGIVYLNRYEGTGNTHPGARFPRNASDATVLASYPQLKGNDSYIAFHPEQIKPRYDVDAAAAAIGPSHAEIMKQWHAAVSGNKPVQLANKVAWNSYADWLDAGKPTDRDWINETMKAHGGISDPLNYKPGGSVGPGIDTDKLYRLINSPEMKGERPFHGDVFSDDTKANPLMGITPGARKIPSMGATVAGKGNLMRLVIDTHIRDFYGQNPSGPAAQYIADSVHLRQAAKDLGLKPGEGQEQLWGTVLGLKSLLLEGLTPEQAGATLEPDIIKDLGKDYAEVILNDPEISEPGGVLDKLLTKHGVGRGASETRRAYREAQSARASAAQPGPSAAPTDTTLLGKTAGRIRSGLSEGKIKKMPPKRGLFGKDVTGKTDWASFLDDLKKPGSKR